MGVTRILRKIEWPLLARALLIALLTMFVVRDLQLLREVLNNQPLGVDFLPLWTGARVETGRLYDFGFVTEQQAWLYTGKVRPFVYPPSALLFVRPFGLMPFWVAYPLFMTLSGALFLWAARRIGADWRVVMLAPAVVLVAVAGQLTFLISGLAMTALALRGRPVLAGVLLAIAGAIKPQMLVLLPLALLAEGNWRTFWATVATAGLLLVSSLPFGASWLEWVQALPRFHDLVQSDWTLLKTAATPYAAWGPLSLVVTVPVAVFAVWFAFRSDNVPRRVLALLGGALAISPYAMNYEVALLVPAVLALEKRPAWTLVFYAALAMFLSGPISLVTAILLLLRDMWGSPDAARSGESRA